MKIVVIGGVAGGATAIARLRRLDENAEIVLLERGKYVSFANCGLPYYIGGSIKERDDLFVTTDQDIIKKYKVDVRVENEAMKISTKDKKVLVKNHATGEEYELDYDKLLLSTGSHPFIPPAEGLDNENVFTLWNIPDVDKISSYIEKNNPKKAVVIGGGFIGLEMVENLVERGIETTVVEMADQVMPPLDKDMAHLVENHLENKGVKLILEQGFEKLENDGKTVVLNSGEKIDTDMTVLSIGVRPNSMLAKEAGIEVTESGHIVVDEKMQTSDSDIYAIGDVIGVKNYITQNPTAIPLAGPANKQGREVATNILGQKVSAYPGSMGTSVAKIFDLTVASTGLNEKTLEKEGKIYKEDYFVSMIHPMSHAGYYPGAKPMSIKLIYGSDGKVLGGQIVGYDGVDKRIDTIATTIYFKGNVDDLSRLELAYAPPYSSAKDPVNFAGFTARNVLDGLTNPLLFREYQENPERYTLLDVREEVEVANGKLEGAINIPLPQLRDRLDELDKDKEYLAYCAVGIRGYIAERILRDKGFKVSNLLGGYRTASQFAENSNNTEILDSTEQDKFQTEEIEVLDVRGLMCPKPMTQISEAMEKLEPGKKIKIISSDPRFLDDMDAFAKYTENKLISKKEEVGDFIVVLEKRRNQI